MKVSGVRMTHRGAMGVNSDGRRTGRLRRGLYVGQKTINGKKYTVFGKDMTEARARLNAVECNLPKARSSDPDGCGRRQGVSSRATCGHTWCDGRRSGSWPVAIGSPWWRTWV
jgi:hypothetical protein